MRSANRIAFPMRVVLMCVAFSCLMPLTGAAAASHRRSTTRLTFARARASIIRYAREDRPTAIAVTHCARRSAVAITCHVVESGVASYWTANGQPIIMRLVSIDTAILRHNRIVPSARFLSFG